MLRLVAPLVCALALLGGCATTSTPEEESLHGAIVQRLAQDPRTGLSQLTVREDQGAVSIGGFISTLEEQRALADAIDDIGRMDGVRSVDDAVSMTAGGS